MIEVSELTPDLLFSTLHDCVVYLFRRRWPHGFVCPFCDRLQKEVTPAPVVVCRFCRKQSSITAHTVMHGSRNGLLAWMLVAWQFCLRKEGISARQIQNLLELSSYQTAWRWLKKIRKGAALAEQAPCRQAVLFQILPLMEHELKDQRQLLVTALEDHPEGGRRERLRLQVLRASELGCLQTVADLVEPGSILFVGDLSDQAMLQSAYQLSPASSDQRRRLAKITPQLLAWLGATHRKSAGGSYLQEYLDEYVFRFNTASWSTRLAVFEHLLGGLLDSSGYDRRKNVIELQSAFPVPVSGAMR